MEIELGYLYSSAGYDATKNFNVTPEEERQRERDALAWHDAHRDEAAFIEWQPFEHPQLGAVELGGWRPEAFGNVGVAERVPVWEKSCRFILELAERGPRLELTHATAEPLGDGLFRITCRVANEGYLPTHVTAQGAKFSHVDGVRVELEREGDITFLSGRNAEDVGHLAASGVRELTWVVRAPAGGQLTLRAHAPRAGCTQGVLELGA